DQDSERLRNAGLERVVALDDRLVGLDAADDVVRLHGQDLLQDVRGAVSLERPYLHLAEALAAELRLAAQRLLGDQAVRTGPACAPPSPGGSRGPGPGSCGSARRAG